MCCSVWWPGQDNKGMGIIKRAACQSARAEFKHHARPCALPGWVDVRLRLTRQYNPHLQHQIVSYCHLHSAILFFNDGYIACQGIDNEGGSFPEPCYHRFLVTIDSTDTNA